MPLPKCTGPFAVGCFDLMTKPMNIPKDFTPASLCDADTDLGTFARIYYPCKSDEQNLKQSSWLPEKEFYLESLMKSVGAGLFTPIVKFFTSEKFVLPVTLIFVIMKTSKCCSVS